MTGIFGGIDPATGGLFYVCQQADQAFVAQQFAETQKQWSNGPESYDEQAGEWKSARATGLQFANEGIETTGRRVEHLL